MRHPFWRRDVLEQRLRESVETLAERAETNTGPDPEEMSRVQALRELIEVRSIVSGRARRTALWTGAGVALVVALLLLRVRSLGVEGVVRASSVDVVMERTAVLYLDAPVTKLSAAGYTRIIGLPAAVGTSLAAASPKRKTLTLEQITIPAGARVRVASTGFGQLLLRVEPTRETGRVRLTTPDGGLLPTRTDTTAIAPGTVVEMEFDTLRFNLQFTPVDPALNLLNDVPARSLSFTQEHVVADGTRQDVLIPSTIEDGELVLPALREQKIALRARERLDLRTQVLRVHRLRSDTGGVMLEFQARASRLTLGEGATLRNLKPSHIEWLAASRPLTLVWVAFGTVLSAMLALIAWWKRY